VQVYIKSSSYSNNSYSLAVSCRLTVKQSNNRQMHSQVAAVTHGPWDSDR